MPTVSGGRAVGPVVGGSGGRRRWRLRPPAWALATFMTGLAAVAWELGSDRNDRRAFLLSGLGLTIFGAATALQLEYRDREP
jgi:hypothetical protein